MVLALSIRTPGVRGRIPQVVLSLGLLMGVMGCQVDPTQLQSNYTTSGQNLGDAPFRPISPAESRVTIPDGDALIKMYEARKLKDRRQEQITLEGGFRYHSWIRIII